MEEREKTDPTNIKPEDATPSGEEAPQPPEPDPDHVVEKKGEQS